MDPLCYGGRIYDRIRYSKNVLQYQSQMGDVVVVVVVVVIVVVVAVAVVRNSNLLLSKVLDFY